MHRRTFLTGLAVGISLATTAHFATPALADSVFTGSTAGVAINGYDPVGYFTQNKPVKGTAEFSLEQGGVKWNFANAENKATFMANPQKYTPKYGGYCAYAMAKGQKAPTDPKAFSVVDGSLYLNYSIGIRERWDSDQANFIVSADKNWPNIK